jgi:hypothetical protein
LVAWATQIYACFGTLAWQTGLFVSLLTAVAGPALEIGLVNLTGLYHYNGADFMGVVSWIPWVYMAGGPAVGNLARATWLSLTDAAEGES